MNDENRILKLDFQTESALYKQHRITFVEWLHFIAFRLVKLLKTWKHMLLKRRNFGYLISLLNTLSLMILA